MRKLYTLVFLLTHFFQQGYAQFPFYGFELSNYEVGDTLEYETYYTSLFNGTYTERFMYIVLAKQSLSTDSVKFTSRIISYKYNGVTSPTEALDTVTRITSSDSVYGNNNNLPGFALWTLPAFDSTLLIPPFDSTYVRYDTISTGKRLKLAYRSYGYHLHYEALQSIGVVQYDEGLESQHSNSTTKLIYANLAHRGKYGKYVPILSGVPHPLKPEPGISIQYEKNGNLWCYYDTELPGSAFMRLYDVTGREAKEIILHTGENPLDINHLPTGMYLYKVISGKEILAAGKLMNLKY